MFSLSALPCQVGVSFSQVPTSVLYLRSIASNSWPHLTTRRTVERKCIDGVDDANITVRELPAELRIGDVAQIAAEILQEGRWRGSTSHVSRNTFFENKYGFSEKELLNPNIGSTWFLHNRRNQSLSTKWLPQSLFCQQHRGLKTQPKIRTSSSMAKERREKDDGGATFLKLGSIWDKRTTDSAKLKEADKFKALLTDLEDSPEIQDKLKIAFAEGYAANAKKGTDKKPSFIRSMITRTLGIGTAVCIAILIVNLLSATGGNIRVNLLNREQYEVNPEEVEVTFDDIRGADEAKQELMDVVEFLRDPEKFKILGAKLPKGVLLVGPPGIGKTLLARAVAGEAKVPFFHASGSEFDEIFVGTGAKRVRQLFGAAKLRTPCLIFIDEIDSVGAKRTSSQIHPYANQTINQLLSEMDGFAQNEGIIVLGATNRRDHLDRALLRPGRFDVEVKVFPPDLKGRIEILELYLDKIKSAPDIDIEKLARSTTGFTGADLENMVNQAALKAAKDENSLVGEADLEFAMDKVLMGPAKKYRITDKEINWLTAYHEAGHTLVAHFTKDAIPLHKVTIIPRGLSLGHTSFMPEKEDFNKTKSQLLAEMDVAMGGRVAEELVYGSEKVTTGASADFQKATAIAKAMVKTLGMSEKVGVRVFDEDDPFDSGQVMLKVNELSQATTELVDSEIRRLLQESYNRAKAILTKHAFEHRNLASALMKQETLNSEEIKAILNGRSII